MAVVHVWNIVVSALLPVLLLGEKERGWMARVVQGEGYVLMLLCVEL